TGRAAPRSRSPNRSRHPGGRAVSAPGARGVPARTAPVHLVLGDDARFRADATKALIADLLGDDDASLALEEFSLAARADAAEGDASPSGDGPPIVDRALSSASTPPFGTERRVIVIRDVGAMSADDAEAVA